MRFPRRHMPPKKSSSFLDLPEVERRYSASLSPLPSPIALLLAIVTISIARPFTPTPTEVVLISSPVITLVKFRRSRWGCLANRLHLDSCVSISSGVAQITSAFPGLLPYRVAYRSRRDHSHDRCQLARSQGSGQLICYPHLFLPRYDVLTIGIAAIQFFTGHLGVVTNVANVEQTVIEPLTLFLSCAPFPAVVRHSRVSKRFSNGIMAFKKPRSHNALRLSHG